MRTFAGAKGDTERPRIVFRSRERAFLSAMLFPCVLSRERKTTLNDCSKPSELHHEQQHLVRELTSIIIPCWNQLGFTQQCLAALKEHTRPAWELIVIDNGSNDGTAAYLAGVRDMASCR